MPSLKKLLEEARKRAHDDRREVRGAKSENKRCSAVWVENVATCFQGAYRTDDAVRIFSKHHEGNRDEFDRSELLFDIAVCRTGMCPAAVHPTMVRYVTEPIWAIESEVERTTPAAVSDFNKLVFAHTPNKLFITSRGGHNEKFRNALLPVARAAGRYGTIFLSTIQHPERWGKERDHSVELYRLENGEWAPSEGPDIP